MKNSLNNPVLSSELKIKMRNWKTFAAISSYVGVMLLIAFIFFKAFIERQMNFDAIINANTSIGLQLYMLLAIVQFILIVLIVPAHTSGAISMERERQTLDLLLCTKIAPLKIVLGKLFSSMSFVLLLIISSIPLFSLVFLFGGVAPKDVFFLFLFYIITAIAIGSMGIFYSTILKKTITATVACYVTVFILWVLSALIGGYTISTRYENVNALKKVYTPFIFYFNSPMGLGDMLSSQATGNIGGINSLFGINHGFVPSVSPKGITVIMDKWEMLSFWIKNSIVMGIVSIILLLISANRINPLNTGFGIKRQDKK